MAGPQEIVYTSRLSSTTSNQKKTLWNRSLYLSVFFHESCEWKEDESKIDLILHKILNGNEKDVFNPSISHTFILVEKNSFSTSFSQQKKNLLDSGLPHFNINFWCWCWYKVCLSSTLFTSHSNLHFSCSKLC